LQGFSVAPDASKLVWHPSIQFSKQSVNALN